MSGDGTLAYVHRYVAPVAAADGTTLLLLHGTGGNEADLLPLGGVLSDRAALLSPRGNVLERGLPRFFRRIAEGVFDVPDLVARTHELADFVGASAARHAFDPTRVIAAGFSNGANIAASMLMLRPGVLRAAILLSPMVPFEPEAPPPLAGTPVFIGAGRHDSVAPAAGAARLAEIFESAGAGVTLCWHEDGHTITPYEVTAAREWLAAVAAVASK